MDGVEGTLYEGEHFQLLFKFNNKYPFDSPGKNQFFIIECEREQKSTHGHFSFSFFSIDSNRSDIYWTKYTCTSTRLFERPHLFVDFNRRLVIIIIHERAFYKNKNAQSR